jgi:hypothetical protein
LKLDYSLATSEERCAFIKEHENEIYPKDLNYVADYILCVSNKNQTKKERKKSYPIMTTNREVTINKRQISYEQLISDTEGGEDAIAPMIVNDKNQILDPKDPITDEDIESSPYLQEALKTLESLQNQFENATGSRKFSLKKQIIETWRQIYILKSSLKAGVARGRLSAQIKTMAHMTLDENITLDDNQMPHSDGVISFFIPEHISFLLCHYPQLKQECEDDLRSDMYHLLLDLENLAEETLAQDHEVLYDLLIWKIDGLTNEEIVRKMEAYHGITHNEQYYSTLWRKRIPKLLVEQATKNYLIYHFTNEEKGNWKECGKCHQIKLAHPLFYSSNTSKDSYYSVCRECRGGK